MPVIDHLPAIKVIKGFRGILDFYCWKSLYCARKWPRIPYANRTPASLASAALFGAVSQGYALLGGVLKTLFAEDAADHNRTGRDLYISATLGHLHEASMSDFLDLLTQATAYLEALATLTKVHGEDQLPSIKDSLLAVERFTVTVAGVQYRTVAGPAEGEYWHVGYISALNLNTACNPLRIILERAGIDNFIQVGLPQPAGTPLIWHGYALLKYGDDIRFQYYGCQIGDLLSSVATGHITTVET